jgi:uncharacterized membrane protein YcaP (DUF421 family)
LNFNSSEIFYVIFRSSVSAILLYLLARLMGKRQIAKLTFFDYVVGISIGSIAGNVSIGKNISIIQGVFSMIVWALFPIAFSFISMKSFTMRKILDGNPAILIQNGNIIEKNLFKSQLTINELLEELRQKDIFDISEVEFAVFETSGKLSILIKPQFKPISASEMNIVPKYKGLCANLIIDGNVILKNLEILGKDQKWLNAKLLQDKIILKNVLLASLDSEDKLTFYLKHNSIKVNNVID